MFRIVRRLLGRRTGKAPIVLDSSEAEILRRCQPHTMTSPERLLAIIDAVRYLCARRIPGALVECGVWRGGSVLAMLLTLRELGDFERDVYLFDTFEGMTAPGERDVSRYEPPALETWSAARNAGKTPWEPYFKQDIFSEAGVRKTLSTSGYPPTRVHFVKGRVEDTLPAQAPAAIALLRLDTDWYESTRHELEHLYPRLRDGGVLIVDDYGHWDGCRQAVDEYIAVTGRPLMLTRIDYTGRLAIKH